MAVLPGSQVGDTTTINGVEYTWDGVAWNKTEIAQDVELDTSQILLSNPTKNGLLSVIPGADGYPVPIGHITQADANAYMVLATDWLRDNGARVEISSTAPDVAEGSLWVDNTTYKLYFLEGTNWIELTQSFDDTINTLSGYMTKSEHAFTMQAYDTRIVADQKFALQDYLTHMLETDGSVRVHGFNGPEVDNLIRRQFETERHLEYIEDKLDELLGDNSGHPPAEASSGQWTYIGYAQGNPGITNWGTSFLVNDFTQITQVTISENSIDGRVFDLDAYEVGDVIDIHRYKGDDPVAGADYNVSAAYYITSKTISTGWGRFDVEIIPNSHHGTITVGDNFSLEKRRNF